MSQTQIEQSKSYREFLLANLRDRTHAAGYLEAALEEQDNDPAFLTQLLQAAIDDVIQAHFAHGTVPTDVSLGHDRFMQSVGQPHSSDIHQFVQLLDALGFKLTITPKD
jgi:DNA-binding phage protein